MILFYAKHNSDRLQWGENPSAVVNKIGSVLADDNIKTTASKMQVQDVALLCRMLLEGMLLT